MHSKKSRFWLFSIWGKFLSSAINNIISPLILVFFYGALSLFLRGIIPPFSGLPLVSVISIVIFILSYHYIYLLTRITYYKIRIRLSENPESLQIRWMIWWAVILLCIGFFFTCVFAYGMIGENSHKDTTFFSFFLDGKGFERDFRESGLFLSDSKLFLFFYYLLFNINFFILRLDIMHGLLIYNGLLIYIGFLGFAIFKPAYKAKLIKKYAFRFFGVFAGFLTYKEILALPWMIMFSIFRTLEFTQPLKEKMGFFEKSTIVSDYYYKEVIRPLSIYREILIPSLSNNPDLTTMFYVPDLITMLYILVVILIPGAILFCLHFRALRQRKELRMHLTLQDLKH